MNKKEILRRIRPPRKLLLAMPKRQMKFLTQIMRTEDLENLIFTGHNYVIKSNLFAQFPE